MDKAVILARGLGTRMRKADDSVGMSADQAAAADTGVKALIPIDRPFLDYVLGALAEAGYQRICLVIGPEHDAIREYYGRTLKCRRLTFDFAVQDQPLGTADAVRAAQNFAAGDDFLVINSDDYYPPPALAALRQIEGNGLAAFERQAMLTDSNIPPERITKFAVVEIDPQGFMKRIIEKPDPQTLENLPEPICLSMNCWRFTPDIFQACHSIAPSPRGELEIPDAVLYLINQMHLPFRALTFKLPVLDMSCRADVPSIKAKLAGVQVNL